MTWVWQTDNISIAKAGWRPAKAYTQETHRPRPNTSRKHKETTMSNVAHNLKITDNTTDAPLISDFSQNYEYVVVVEDQCGREHCLIVHPESDRLVAVLRAARAMALEKGIKGVAVKEILLCREPF